MIPPPWRVLPHGPRFLFVDRLLELEPGTRAVGRKLVTANEALLTGHFPGNPIFPGVLLLEALAQVGGIAWLGSAPAGTGAVLAGVSGARFRRPVLPGDAVDLEARVIRVLGTTARVQGTARVEGEEAASAELTLARGRA
ncbi:MAG: 3-hydroxyacyl-ACP dehydratase FabZ [Thermodesulfobacteriota bacterium]